MRGSYAVIETSGHMPECPWPTEPCSHTPMQDREPLLCMDCLTECICDRLRACEERKDAEWQRALNAELQYAVGYSDALDAAREAVDAIKDEYIGDKYKYERLALRVALAAIDALRGES